MSTTTTTQPLPAKAAPGLGGLRTILVPTDYSEPAAEAVRRAAQLAQTVGARLVLLHVFDDADFLVTDSMGLGLMGPLAEYRAQARGVAEKELEAQAQALRDRGLQAEARFCVGHPARQITATATECRADLIVMSTHGRAGWKRLTLGSVAESVVRHAPCPVYTHHAHPETAGDPTLPSHNGKTLSQPPLRLRRILVPSDLSLASSQALPWAESLAKESGAILTLLYVFTPSRLTPGGVGSGGLGLATPLMEGIVREVRKEIEEQFHALGKAVRERGTEAEVLFLEGDASERITAAAESIHCDLIVLATRGHTGWDYPLLGTTTERVVRHAHAPVLVVRGTA